MRRDGEECSRGMGGQRSRGMGRSVVDVVEGWGGV